MPFMSLSPCLNIHSADLGGHAMLATAFGAAGYWFHGLEGRQNELIAKKKEQLLRNRERLAAAAAQQSQGAEEEE